jgi:hypothetical protein
MSMIACTAASHLRYARINHSCRATGSCWKYALESTGFDPLVGSDGFDPLWSGPALRIIGPSAKQKNRALIDNKYRKRTRRRATAAAFWLFDSLFVP